MTTRTVSPTGAPCWVDLWTSDVEGVRTFYAYLLGWEAMEPSPEFGGYFMWHRDGVPVAGGMGPMGDLPASNRWRVYLDVPDIDVAVAAASVDGSVLLPAMPVADLGIQAVVVDPGGADVGMWQAGTFPGFTTLNEPGAPSWFELVTWDFATTTEFYRTVFHWTLDVISDLDEFRYSTVRGPDGEVAGVGDGTPMMAEGEPGAWSVYWESDDLERECARATELGGTVLDAPTDTPYGRLATLADPEGARFKLRTSPS